MEDRRSLLLLLCGSSYCGASRSSNEDKVAELHAEQNKVLVNRGITRMNEPQSESGYFRVPSTRETTLLIYHRTRQQALAHPPQYQDHSETPRPVSIGPSVRHLFSQTYLSCLAPTATMCWNAAESQYNTDRHGTPPKINADGCRQPESLKLLLSGTQYPIRTTELWPLIIP